MKKNWNVSILLLILLLVACTANESAHQHEYTCPMHPTVISDRPGTCPVCGMDLVRKARPGEEGEITADVQRMLKSPGEAVIGNYKAIRGTFRTMPIEVEADGIVTYDPRQIFTIPARVSGRLEKVYIKHVYQRITKGQLIAEIYSPEMVNAQRELVFVLENDSENEGLVDAAKRKLRLYGMAESDISRVVRTRRVSNTISLYSPHTGYVISNNESQSAESARLTREGDYTSTGQTLFRLVTDDAFRIDLNVSQAYSKLLSKGDSIELIPEDGVKQVSTVDIVQPFIEGNQKFVKVRVYPREINGLQFGRLVKARLRFHSDEKLWVPREAVLHLGHQDVVFVLDHGVFKPKRVTTGITAERMIMIDGGLASADEIAANAQLLVDSESFLPQDSEDYPDGKSADDQHEQIDHAQHHPSRQTGGQHATLMLSDRQIRLANVTTQRVEMKPVTSTTTISGRLSVDENSRRVISSRATGRVEKLFVKETGHWIEKGQPLYILYSEELLTLQQEYLLAKEQYESLKSPRYRSFFDAAERKLLLYGLTKSDLSRLPREGTSAQITFVAPSSGLVTEISVEEGQYVKEGSALYRIDDTRTLWVEAELYSNEAGLVKPGDRINVRANVSTTAEVTFLSPEVRNNSQIVIMRAAIKNPENKLRPGERVDVQLIKSQKQGLAVPVGSVIRDEHGNHVFMQAGKNSFRHQPVTLGFEGAEWVEVTRGLSEGDTIAATGTYLLYSEMVLRHGEIAMQDVGTKN